MALIEAGRAYRQTASAGTSLVVEPEERDGKPFIATGRATFADFFPMFDVPFLYGSGWTGDADANRELVTVLSRATNERVFGGVDSVGRNIRMGQRLYRVVGVLDDWGPVPRFYDITTGPFDRVEDVFVPFNVMVDLNLSRRGNTNCWKPADGGFDAFLSSECIWIQFWAELRDANERDAYLGFLNDYVSEQKKLGRFQRELNNAVSDVNEWMSKQRVVQDEAKMMLAVATMFLAVCLLNTIGLLLSKFMSKAPEIGLRRALGASRSTLFYQYLVESACIGVVGGVVGLALTWLGLKGLLAIFGDIISNLLTLDWVMVVTAVVLAIIASVAAGLYPTWRACSIEPAAQLKSQ